MLDSLTLDGLGPTPIRRPETVAELGELVREAVRDEKALYPFGGRTKLDFGLPPTRSGFAVDCRAFNTIVDYPARDLTITVGAGVTIAALQKALAAEGQRLPIDIPNPDESTLAGAIATNTSGPRRFLRGTLRDAVIGISFLTDVGVEVKGGGRVVKNVAGYDLMKLQIGAMGTLGILTQVTLKVTPKPDDQAFVVFGINAASIGPTLDRLHNSASRPAAIEVLNSAAVQQIAEQTGIPFPTVDPWLIVAGFEEKAPTVAWQVGTLKDELKAAPVRNVTEFRGVECDKLWHALTQLQSTHDSRFSFKANVLASEVGQFLSTASAANADLILHAHAGNGIVYGHIHAELTVDQASAILAKLTPSEPGNLIVRRCPTEWKNVLPIWGRSRHELSTMQTVKKMLDPNNVFNPGRLFKV